MSLHTVENSLDADRPKIKIEWTVVNPDGSSQESREFSTGNRESGIIAFSNLLNELSVARAGGEVKDIEVFDIFDDEEKEITSLKALLLLSIRTFSKRDIDLLAKKAKTSSSQPSVDCE